MRHRSGGALDTTMIRPHHEAFRPPSSNCTLWRYMDFAKLLSLLETRSLYFPRSDTFDDPYEGTLSKAMVERLKAEEESGAFPKGMVDFYIRSLEFQRRNMYVSCWFMSDHESAAMWKLYLQGSDGVAIRTTYSSLVKALTPSPLSIGVTTVQYADYYSTPISFGNIFFPFTYKRISFEHEKELRAIVWATEEANRPNIEEGTLGVAVSIDPAELIRALHVAPTAPKWFGDLVTSVMARYGTECPVIHSTLYERSAY